MIKYNNDVPIKLQICSDIHLEDNPGTSFDNIIVPLAPYLFIAGDVGNPYSSLYANFLEYCSKNYERVFIVAGNHEFYNTHTDIESTLKHIASICKSLGNIDLLNCNSSHFLKNIRVIGATLWSKIPKNIWHQAIDTINDFKYINYFTPSINNTLNQKHVQWILSQIEQAKNNDELLIIMTHHAPSMINTSHKRFERDPLRFCYRNNLDHMISLPTNILWIYGHTHHSIIQKRGKTILMSNQYMSAKYKKDLVIEI